MIKISKLKFFFHLIFKYLKYIKKRKMFISNFNSSDPSRPSFFEMIAQQEMIPTLKPALRYVLSVKNSSFFFFLK